MTEWTVAAESSTRAGGQGEWQVAAETPSRGRRGGAAPQRTGVGSSPENPVPRGQAVPVGQYGEGPDGSIQFRTANGWRLVQRGDGRPANGRGGGIAGVVARDRERRLADVARPDKPREDRSFLGWRWEDLARPPLDALATVADGYRTPPPNPFDKPGWTPLDIPGDLAATAGRNIQQGNNLLGLAFSPVSGAINEVAAPLGRGLTNLGVGNDNVNTNSVARVLNLLAPERPRGGFAAAAGNPLSVAGGRYGAVPSDPAPVVPPVANDVPPPAARPRPQGGRRQDQVNLLRREGVEVTPGQKRGGVWAGIEDRATSAPILGDAITEARNQSRLALNRAVANRALAPIGETLPGSVATGSDAVGYVEGRIGEAYAQAAGAVKSAQADNELLSELGSIREANATDLPPPLAEQWDKIIGDRVTARFANGPVDGAMLKEIQSELGSLAAKYSSSSDGAQRIFGERLLQARDALGGLVGRASPEAASLQAKADRAWANFVRFQTAAAGAGEGGVFTPAQLRAAVKGADRSVRKGAVARGDALMQDLADASVGVMNSRTPDSGTAGRNMQAGLGFLIGSNPVTGAVAAGGLGAASIPYRVMARRLAAAALRDGATREEVQASLDRLRVLVDADPKAVTEWLRKVEAVAKAYGLVGNEVKQPTK